MTFVAQPSMLMQTAEDLICAALRGEHPAWPWDGDVQRTEQFHGMVDLHGVGPLLHLQARLCGWPAPVLERLRQQAVEQAMWELRHQQLLSQALAHLATAGIEPVLIKGTALAYSLYPDAALRTRADTDLLIPPQARDQAHAALESAGFQRSMGVSGDVVSYQANYSCHFPNGGSHALDVHWRINNSEVLARLFTHEELRRDALPIPALGPQAFGASPVHALLLACMHRSTHKQNPYHVRGQSHHTANRLIWLYDIHLLARSFSAQAWTEFTRAAHGKGLRAVCLDGMREAAKRFHIPYPDAVLAELAQSGPAERPAIYLEGSALRQRCMDFVALGSLRRQGRLLHELFFPSRDYMRAKFPMDAHRALPWLYLRRSFSGAARRWARLWKS